MARVLVIDDNASLRALLRLRLEETGHEVVEAVDGDEGLRLYREAGADLVLCDLFLPGKNGVETIRELCQGGGPRVIAMTGDPELFSGPLLRMAERSGAVTSLPKPFGDEQLQAAVRAALAEG
jgi:CheY-like chemotaxis protein